MIIDSHVHLMPPKLGKAIRRFFDEHLGGQLVYELDTTEVLDRHHVDGVAAVWNLPYAHKPGMADDLNASMAAVSESHADHPVQLVTGCTTHVGDDKPGDTIRQAHDTHGARVVKLHCSVGNYDANDPRLDLAYAAAGELSMPVIVHVGHDISGHTHAHELGTIDEAAGRHPGTTIIVAHCGHHGYRETLDLMGKHENLWADLTPVVTERPGLNAADLNDFNDRLLLGTDAPNVAMTLASHLEWLGGLDVANETRANVLGANANRLVPLS